jgi:2-isopropylmalate synthase
VDGRDQTEGRRFFSEIRKSDIGHAKIAAFGSTRRPRTKVKDDPFLRALADSGADTITIVAKSWDFHVTEALASRCGKTSSSSPTNVALSQGPGIRGVVSTPNILRRLQGKSRFRVVGGYKGRGGRRRHARASATQNGGTLPHEIDTVTRAVVKEVKKPSACTFTTTRGWQSRIQSPR